MRDIIFRYRENSDTESEPSELRVCLSTHCNEASFSFAACCALQCSIKKYNLYDDEQFTLLVNGAPIDPLLTVQEAFRDTPSITIDVTVKSHLDCIDFEYAKVYIQNSDEWESRPDFPPTLYWLSVFKSSLGNWCVTSHFVWRYQGELSSDEQLRKFDEYELPERREPYMDRRYAAIARYINSINNIEKDHIEAL